MIEVSITEIALFAWAIIATGYALKNHHENQKSNVFIHALMNDDALRNEIVNKYKEVRDAN